MFQRLHRILLCLVMGTAALAQEAKFIRLRNETISTPPISARSLSTTPDPAEPAVSGLYLVQFQKAPQPGERAALQARGVELLNYVPDDAFVARLTGVRLSSLRAEPGVRWVGPYEARHKMDPRLKTAFVGRVGARIPIRLLTRPDLGGPDLALVFRHLQGAQRRVSLSMGTTYEGFLNLAQLRVLAQSPAVLWIEPGPKMKLVDAVSTEIVSGEFPPGGDRTHLQQLGYDGRGVIVSVADSGLDSGDPEFIHPDLEGRIEALFAYDNLPDASDEHSHGTHCAGIVLGNGATGERDDSGYLYGLGVAPGARLVAQRIFDGSGGFRPPESFTKLVQDAVRSGAYVGSNSWGDDNGGQYDLSAAEFDARVRDADPDFPGEQGYVLEFSAGNSGPGAQTIGTPAVAKNVIATGATQNNRFEFPLYGEGQEVMADFSSRGPAADGRIKPDLVAPGTWIASLRSIFANDNNAWGPISDRYLYQGGTSQAGPHAAGGAAVVVQWYRDQHAGSIPSPALVKALLINSADDMATAVIPNPEDPNGEDPGDGTVVGDTGPIPNQDEGWGRMNLVNLMDSDRRFELADQGAGLATGQVVERRAVVGSGDQLKVTLVYTDVPALPAAIPALVNDLDLEVVAPNGDVYRGNAFNDGEAVAGTVSGDRINNVEGVHLSAPAAGEWIVRVRGHNVVADVHNRTGVPPEQDFALVISGQLPAPGEGVISWDRGAYRAPATATLRLVDQQLAGQATVSVTVRGPTEPAGETVVLSRVGNGGNFIGTVGLVSGSPTANDGRLSVADGDELTALYRDASPAGDRTATAQVDAQPPIISGVTAVREFGRIRIEWLNSEPASSRVWFGTTNAVTNLVSDPAFRLQPSLNLPTLEPGTTYFFYVAATDRAGNASTNDNGGVLLRVVAPRAASALLVYSPEKDFEQITDTVYPGIESWTSALDALHVDYEVWDTSVVGEAPKAEDLRPYRLVVWRPEEASVSGPLPGITSAIRSYVQSGGSLLVVSHDVLSRLSSIPSEAGFITDILHVKSFLADQGAYGIRAVPGDVAGAGLETLLDYGGFPEGLTVDILFSLNGLSGWNDVTDHITPSADAAPVFLQDEDRVVGLRYPRTGQDSSVGRVVFYAFPFEAVPLDAPAPNNRPTLLANAMRFLTPELSPGGAVAFDQGAYTVPGNVVLDVIDSDRAGAGTVSITVSNGADQQTLVLAETPRRGIFRGRLTLQDPAQPKSPGRLGARHGDVLVATYADAANAESSATASIDTSAPRISGITTDSGYNEAYVSWTTDKPTDALVRFGESGGDESFLTRNGYNAELGTGHEVRLTGLLPDRTYYFQVVSRDAAGNLTADGSNGDFHTVQTLKPLAAPWEDPLDSAQDGWVVFNDTSSAGASIPDDDEGGGDGFAPGGWSFGVPENIDGIPAHTGTNVWATNLKGADVDLAITDLISPAIGLIGGNKATLRFWQYYDFSTSGGGEDDPFGDFVLEAAQIAVSKDDGATWQDVYAAGDEFSAGWEEVEVDLSKFLGSVVRIRFNYQLFVFTPGPRMGWMLDDVRIEMNVVPETRVTVTNNLEQAAFTLAGPVTASGSGSRFETNLPPGTYVITWAPVPYFATPPPETGTLGVAGPLAFSGRYTFPDRNGNGISDLWEEAYFGAAEAGFTGFGDTDADGAADAAEWQAGTDPLQAADVLKLETPESLPNGTIRFRWPTTPGRRYSLETANQLGDWAPVGSAARGSGSPMSLTLPALDPRLPYFFRVVVTP